MPNAAPVTAAEFAAAMAVFAPYEPSPLIIVAVSGGRDSLALTLLAEDWCRSQQGQLLAVTIDHALRPDSANEARQVAEWMSARGISHQILPLEYSWKPGAKQEQARQFRYERLDSFCREQGALHLLTAHHADDQAETCAMRQARPGQGIRGAAGMSAVRELPNCRLLRPLLRTPRKRLEAVLRQAHQPWIDDPSNDDQAFERVRVRARSDRQTKEIDVAEAAHQRQEFDQQVANLAARSVSVDMWGRVKIDRYLIENEEENQSIDVLGAAFAVAGGAEFPPRRENTKSIRHQLKRGARSLGGCVASIRGPHIILRRELGRLRSDMPISDGETVQWDGRFLVHLGAGLGDGKIAALGTAGATAWQKGDFAGPVPPLSVAELAVLPAFWQENRIKAVPLLEPGPALTLHSGQSVMTDQNQGCNRGVLIAMFAPRRSLIAAPFEAALDLS